MAPKELEYYQQRATAERERAEQSSGEVAKVHAELARLYEKLIELKEGAELQWAADAAATSESVN